MLSCEIASIRHEKTIQEAKQPKNSTWAEEQKQKQETQQTQLRLVFLVATMVDTCNFVRFGVA